MDHPVLLEMKGISKEFPGVKALDNVNLTVRAGTVHALMGENGAGKSGTPAPSHWTARRSTLKAPRRPWKMV